MTFPGRNNSGAPASLSGAWCQFTKRGGGRTEPYRHEAWQAKVPPSRCVQSQTGSWLRELDVGGRELLVPDLQRTDCALYRVSLPGSPAQFDTDWGA